MDRGQKSLPCQCTGCLLLQGSVLDPFTGCCCSLVDSLLAAVGRVCNTGGELVALDTGKQGAGRSVQHIVTRPLES